MAHHRGPILVGLMLLALAVACAPPTGAPTRLEITTVETICGGVFNPDLPPCHSSDVPRRVEVLRGRIVVASVTTDAAGHAVLDVPASGLVVSAPDAPSYMDCDSPSVAVGRGTTTRVTQTCTIRLP